MTDFQSRDMTWKVPLFKIYWEEDDVTAVSNAIKAGMYWAIGPQIEEFERLIAKYIGRKYAVTMNSGTSALHALLLAYGIGPGDEVIVPSFTFIATANVVVLVGAKPVFAEIEPETFGLDPKDVERKITSKTKAIIPIHYGGSPCKIRELKEVADKHGILLLEDAAESFGATVAGKQTGTFSDSAMLSFCSNKVISTGEGGAIVTDDQEIFEKLELLRSHGRVDKKNYFESSDSEYVQEGYNFRMSNITAALGVSQIKKVDKILARRRKNALYMSSELRKIPHIKINEVPKDYFHVYQMLTIRSERRDALMKHLADNGILTKIFFHPVHKTKFYTRITPGVHLPVTEKISSQVISLPIYTAMTQDEMDTVLKTIRNFE